MSLHIYNGYIRLGSGGHPVHGTSIFSLHTQIVEVTDRKRQTTKNQVEFQPQKYLQSLITRMTDFVIFKLDSNLCCNYILHYSSHM